MAGAVLAAGYPARVAAGVLVRGGSVASLATGERIARAVAAEQREHRRAELAARMGASFLSDIDRQAAAVVASLDGSPSDHDAAQSAAPSHTQKAA